MEKNNDPAFAFHERQKESKADRAHALDWGNSQVDPFYYIEIKCPNSLDTAICSTIKVLPLWLGTSKAAF